jgi:flagellar biogenesis protein FliO
VDAVVTVGSVTVNPAGPYTAIQQTTKAVTSTGTQTTPLASRRFIQIINVGTETVWLGIGFNTATVSVGVPVLTNQYYSEELDASLGVGVIASTPSTVTIIQGY